MVFEAFFFLPCTIKSQPVTGNNIVVLAETRMQDKNQFNPL